uniref:Uncharacterized protein n=1 Tax=Heterorhabditis bacteriophora TaxID=37862 RepID=A0A1I7X9N5_HETBA
MQRIKSFLVRSIGWVYWKEFDRRQVLLLEFHYFGGDQSVVASASPAQWMDYGHPFLLRSMNRLNVEKQLALCSASRAHCPPVSSGSYLKKATSFSCE